jgi:chromosome segregation ATPase
MSGEQILQITGKLNEVIERLARLEEALNRKDKQCSRNLSTMDEYEQRLRKIEQQQSGWRATLNFLCWGVTAAIAVYNAFER